MAKLNSVTTRCADVTRVNAALPLLIASRATFKAVQLAMHAEQDAGPTWGDEPRSAARWWPALGSACSQAREARDLLTVCINTPAADWWTPLNLAEALHASMYGAGMGATECLAHDETILLLSRIITFCDEAIEVLHHWRPD